MKHLPVSGGHFALVDDEDFDRLSQFTWCLQQTLDDRRYAKRTINGKKIYLHHEVLQIKNVSGDIDHRNRNGLDCQKHNLRSCSRSQNSANARKTSRKTTSRFKGVSWFKPAKMWRAYISMDQKRIWLGYFKCEIEAAKAYDEAAKKYFKEFARLNLK